MSLDRQSIPDNVLDRLEQLESRMDELMANAVLPQSSPDGGDDAASVLSGWVIDGGVLRDAHGHIVLDPSIPGIQVGANGRIYSANYAAGSAGFSIDGGTAEFNDVVVRGTIYADAGDIAGWTINTAYLARDTGNDATSSGLAPDDYPLYVGATYAHRATAPFRVTPAGALTATNATITGTITATTGTIGGWTIGASTIASGSMTLNSSTPALLAGSATGYMTGTGIWMGNDGGTYKLHIGNPAGFYLSWDGSAINVNGAVSSGSLNPALQGWTTTIVFSSTDNDTVSWAAGTIRLTSAQTYSIDAGNTGNMAALTYIYLDTAVSTTALQITTTYSSAVGDGRILVAAAQNHAAGASVIPLGGQQPIINGTDQITALSIVAGSIAAGAVTATKISVSDLSAINANLGTITAGTITGGIIRTAASGARIEFNTTLLFGTDGSTTQFYVSAATGKLYAAAGNVVIDNAGMTMLCQTVGAPILPARHLLWYSVNDSSYRGVIANYAGTIQIEGQSSVEIWTNAATLGGGTLVAKFFSGGGVNIGAPAGGDKGAGTLNVAGDIYKNDTAYTNPDYVLELWATGRLLEFALRPGASEYRRMSLDEIENYIRSRMRLPGISDEPAGIFDMADIALEKIEELYTHVVELHHRVRELESEHAEGEHAEGEHAGSPLPRVI